MNKKIILHHTSIYDEKVNARGVLTIRSLKTEPHYDALKTFMNKIDDAERNFTDAELMEFIGILLSKTTTDKNDSGKLFSSLASYFGGYSALKLIGAIRQPAVFAYQYLEKYPGLAKSPEPGKPGILAVCISKMAGKLPDDKIKCLLMAFENRAEYGALSTDILPFFNEIFLSEGNNQATLVELLQLLNQHDIKTDQVLVPLKLLVTREGWRVVNLNTTLQCLSDWQKDLLNMHNLGRLMTVKDTTLIDKFFKTLPANQNNLDVLLDLVRESPATIQSTWLAQILGQFHLAGWDITPWFRQIVANPDSLYPLAVALTTLRLEKGIDYKIEDIIRALVKKPQYSQSLVKALILLPKSDWSLVTRFPAQASIIASVISFLRQENLYSQSMVTAVSQAGLVDESLLLLFKYLQTADLLTPENISKLESRLGHIKLLYEAVKSLSDGHVLNQTNFDSLIIEPANAMIMAENLGGKMPDPVVPLVAEISKDRDLSPPTKLPIRRPSPFFFGIFPEKPPAVALSTSSSSYDPCEEDSDNEMLLFG